MTPNVINTTTPSKRRKLSKVAPRRSKRKLPSHSTINNIPPLSQSPPDATLDPPSSKKHKILRTTRRGQKLKQVVGQTRKAKRRKIARSKNNNTVMGKTINKKRLHSDLHDSENED